MNSNVDVDWYVLDIKFRFVWENRKPQPQTETTAMIHISPILNNFEMDSMYAILLYCCPCAKRIYVKEIKCHIKWTFNTKCMALQWISMAWIAYQFSHFAFAHTHSGISDRSRLFCADVVLSQHTTTNWPTNAWINMRLYGFKYVWTGTWKHKFTMYGCAKWMYARMVPQYTDIRLPRMR